MRSAASPPSGARAGPRGTDRVLAVPNLPNLPVTVTVPRPVVAGALVLAALGVLTLLWIGGELHYENCVAAAEAETRPAGSSSSLSRRGEFEQRVAGCSRLPF